MCGMLKSPVGTLTFLMTDIEGSTRLWEEYPAAMSTAIVRSEQIIHDVVTGLDGYHVIEQGEGDSTLSVFKDATQALLAADEIRQHLAMERWPDGLVIRVRIGLHSGVADMRQQTYYGRVVNRAARVRAVAHGGQIILTRATRELLDRQRFPSLKDHGPHRLKDLLSPEHLFELRGDEDFPPFRTLSSRPNNLPIQLTPFVGRATDIQGIQERLHHSRLVTLLGAGGCGKTRLALQTAAEVVDRFADGTFFIDLTASRSSDDVLGAVFRASRSDSIESLLHSEVLLVVDNCEHMVGEAAVAIETLLSSTHQLIVLATSRAALQLRPEVIYRVSPMTLPLPRDLDSLEKVHESEAVQLFVERAGAKLAEFELTVANCRTIGEICIRLDGIALAIELAVPRLKLLAPDELLMRLSDRFKLLASTDRTESRHRTLLETIGHSYDLLTEDEQAMFRGLAVFRSGWTIDAAKAVVPEEFGESALELLESLYDKSLIQHVLEGSASRSFLLESVRDFALLELARSGYLDIAYRRLHAWSLATATEQNRLLRQGQGDASARLDLEIPNAEEAIDWTIRRGEPNLGIELAAAVWEHWSRRGTFVQARHRMRQLLGLDGASNYMKGLGSSILGTLAWSQGDLDEAQRSYAESLDRYQLEGDETKIVRAQNNLGLIAALRGDLDAARTHFGTSLERSEAMGDSTQALTAGINLGTIELDDARISEARILFERMLPRAQAFGDQVRISILHGLLAEAELWSNNPRRAAGWLLESLPTYAAGLLPAGDAIRFNLISACTLAASGDRAAAATTRQLAEAMLKDSGTGLTGREAKLDAELRRQLRNLRRRELESSKRLSAAMDLGKAANYISSALHRAIGQSRCT